MHRQHPSADYPPKVDGLVHAETMTKLLFDSDYSNLRANDIIESLRDDPRLVLVNEVDIIQTSLPKLAAKYGLVASNCMLRSRYFSDFVI